ncbi:hypothetical protein Tco_1289194 [Tanacetum coccineum]
MSTPHNNQGPPSAGPPPPNNNSPPPAVRILQKSQENGQSRTNTNTRRKREYKSRGFDSKKGQKSTPVNL